MYNQLLPGFASNRFETSNSYYKHNEDVHMISSKKENKFLKNYGILDLDNFQVRLQCGVANLYNQSFQTMNWKHIIGIISILKMCIGLLAGKKIVFDNITAFWA